MKNYFTFLALCTVCLISFSSLSGQTVCRPELTNSHNTSTVSATGPAAYRGASQVYAILAKQEQRRITSLHRAEKTANYSSERLIASSSYRYDLDTASYYPGIFDSSSFKYTGQEGSIFNRDMLGFLPPADITGDVLMGYFDNGYFHASAYDFFPVGVGADTFLYWDSDIHFDTTRHGIFSYAEEIYNAYDVNGNVLFMSDQTNPLTIAGPWYEYLNTYDANNNKTSSLCLSWNGASFDTYSTTIYTYNTSQQLVMDSTGGHDDWIDYYDYTSGNLTHAAAWGGSMKNNEHVFTYNSDNTLRTDSVSAAVYIYYSMGPVEVETFGYTPGVDFWTSLQTIVYGDASYTRTLMNKHVALSGVCDTLLTTEYEFTPLNPAEVLYEQEKIGLNYDSYNNPTTACRFSMNMQDSTWPASPTSIVHYYYEPYEVSAVKNVGAVAENIQIYPNPATDMIYISRPEAAYGSMTFIGLANLEGQTIRTASLPWLRETETFPLTGLAPGVYFLTIRDQPGNVLSVQKVLKQ